MNFICRYKNARYKDKKYGRLVYTGYLIYSIILLKNVYKEFNAETENEKLTKVKKACSSFVFWFHRMLPNYRKLRHIFLTSPN